MTSYEGTLEINHENGMIYFHVASDAVADEIGTVTLLRIGGLPKPISKNRALDVRVKDCVASHAPKGTSPKGPIHPSCY